MKLYRHQQEIINDNPLRCGIFWDCGAGKTITAITLVENNTFGNEKKLVICPKSIKDIWIGAISSYPNWLVMTKEEFRRDWKNIPMAEAVVFDEFHFFSGYKSQMHKNALNYVRLHNPRCIYGLTATPFLSSPFNIWAEAAILGYNWSWYKFYRYFFYEVIMGSRKIPMLKPNMESELSRMVNAIGRTVKLSDVFDVPEQIFQTEYFDLTNEQRQAINGLDDVNHLTRWTKTHQIIGGSLKGDGYVEDKYFKSEKLDRIKELAKEHPKLIVVCRYNNELEMLKSELLKIRPCEILNGQTKDRTGLIKRANNEKEFILLCQAAVSEGWECPDIPMMIFYSYDFSYKNYKQIMGRILRANRLKSNVYLSLVVKGGIDEEIFKTITIKKKDFDIEIFKK